MALSMHARLQWPRAAWDMGVFRVSQICTCTAAPTATQCSRQVTAGQRNRPRTVSRACAVLPQRLSTAAAGCATSCPHTCTRAELATCMRVAAGRVTLSTYSVPTAEQRRRSAQCCGLIRPGFANSSRAPCRVQEYGTARVVPPAHQPTMKPTAGPRPYCAYNSTIWVAGHMHTHTRQGGARGLVRPRLRPCGVGPPPCHAPGTPARSDHAYVRARPVPDAPAPRCTITARRPLPPRPAPPCCRRTRTPGCRREGSRIRGPRTRS
jgi:hypothetical protein